MLNDLDSTKRSGALALAAIILGVSLVALVPGRVGLAELVRGDNGATIMERDTSRVGEPGDPELDGLARGVAGPYLSETIILDENGVPTVTNPDSREVVVNKERALPDGYRPPDLVYPNVPFSFSERIEKRMLRREAASALEELFAAAAADGIELVGISAFRSQRRQGEIFARQVRTKGEREAARVSAYPRRSEHQTGLAIDVSSPSVGYALSASFGASREGQWLARNAHYFGFIVRYPAGMEERTGYIWEPWHIRYVGKEIAAEIAARGITLEEFFTEAR